MGKTKFSLMKKVLIHGSIGCLIGVLFLHPISMFIYNIAEYNTFQHPFATKHLLMAGYFGILGGMMGVFNAIYAQKRAKLYEEIKFLSITDELTSLYNRRYLMSQLKKEMERAHRYSRHLSLLMIDIDNFKQYNDIHGHQQGDKRLRAVAMLLKNSVRSPDFVARYGGDEFVIVMPEANKDKALKLVERLHAKVETYPFTDQSTQTEERVTISIGTATFPSEAKDMDGLFNKADSVLYMAKNRSVQKP